MSRDVCIIGIGNEYRNDDGVGLLVAHRIKELCLPGVRVIGPSDQGGDLLSALTSADSVFLVDSVSSGSLSGTIHRIDVSHQTLPAGFSCHSTHAFGVAESLELARILGMLPKNCVLFGIEGTDFEMGTSLSPAVEQAAEEVIAMIGSEINSVIFTAVPEI